MNEDYVFVFGWLGGLPSLVILSNYCRRRHRSISPFLVSPSPRVNFMPAPSSLLQAILTAYRPGEATLRNELEGWVPAALRATLGASGGPCRESAPARLEGITALSEPGIEDCH